MPLFSYFIKWITHSYRCFFEYGHGKAFISDPHMELEEWRDPDSEWPMLKLWINAAVGDKAPEVLEN